MAKAKPILNGKDVIKRMVAGATLEEAVEQQHEVTKSNSQGGSDMDNAVAYKHLEGQPVLVHTASYAFAGRLVHAGSNALQLEDATWIADIGFLDEALKKCQFKSSTHIGQPAIINVNSIVYCFPMADMPKQGK